MVRWNWPLKGGVAILVLGTGPLFLYILFGPGDGNPIGLGLLFFFTAPLGLAFTAWGALLLWMDKRNSKDTSQRVYTSKTARKHGDDWSA